MCVATLHHRCDRLHRPSEPRAPIQVPHLGGSTIGYRLGKPYDPSLSTLVQVNSFATSSELYRPQFADPTLSRTANLLAIEHYGHGATRTSSEQFTYWDSAVVVTRVPVSLC